MDISPEIQMAEAARLKAIYTARKQADRSLTQERVAEMCGWSGQSAVSQYMTGKIPLNLPALLKLAAALQFQPSEVSLRLAGIMHYDTSLPPHTVGRTSANDHPALYPVEVWDDETPLGPDEVELPFFQEVELSAGKGSEVMLETGGRKLRFGRRTLQRKGVPPEAAACVPVTGNSMEPVLPDGSTAGIDTSAIQVQDGKMYAIDHSGQLRVKLLYKLPAGGLRLKSYNSDEHPDERYEAEYVNEHIRIIGKVFWYSVLL